MKIFISVLATASFSKTVPVQTYLKPVNNVEIQDNYVMTESEIQEDPNHQSNNENIIKNKYPNWFSNRVEKQVEKLPYPEQPNMWNERPPVQWTQKPTQWVNQPNQWVNQPTQWVNPNKWYNGVQQAIQVQQPSPSPATSPSPAASPSPKTSSSPATSPSPAASPSPTTSSSPTTSQMVSTPKLNDRSSHHDVAYGKREHEGVLALFHDESKPWETWRIHEQLFHDENA